MVLNWSESNPGFSTTVDLAFPEKIYMVYYQRQKKFIYQIRRKYDNQTSISVNVNSYYGRILERKASSRILLTVELHNSTALMQWLMAKEVVTINGFATYEFYTACRTYYIVKHRNIQTWSAAPRNNDCRRKL